MKQPDGSYAPAAVSSGLVLSGGGNATIATISKGGASIAAEYTGGASAALPTPTVTGSTATYPEVRPGVDLAVTATGSGFETSWVIKTRPVGPVSFDFPVTYTGLTPTVAADGSVEYKDAKGKTTARGGVPLLLDASKDPVSGRSNA